MRRRDVPTTANNGSATKKTAGHDHQDASSKYGVQAELNFVERASHFSERSGTFRGASTTPKHSEVIDHVSGVIKRRFGPTYNVEPFGSTVYMRGFGVSQQLLGNQNTNGLYRSKGDLDLVILDMDRPFGFTPDVDINKLPAIYNIWRLAAVFSRAGFKDVQPVPTASVPIVKFQDPRTQLSIDINVNDRLGLMNSHLLRNYCDVLPGLRKLLAVIKLWALPLDLNNPSGGANVSFSTYALTLMTLGWLQFKGLAPNLQHGFDVSTELAKEGSFWIRSSTRAKNATRLWCDVRFRPVTAQDCYPPLPVEETFADWLHFWGHAFDFEHHSIDIKDGGVHPRPDAMMQSDAPRLSNVVCVVDPFIRSRNVTRSVGHDTLDMLRTECRLTLDVVRTRRLPMSTIISGYGSLQRLREPRVSIP
ncbi:hypothetical protein J3A83DRAFT_4283989 [Scleroderma citrinum]